jgi:hypothetical protein
MVSAWQYTVRTREADMKRILSVALTSTALVACGGGGGGGSTAPVAVTPPVVTVDPVVPLAQAYKSMVVNGFSGNFVVSGTVGSASTPLTGSGSIVQSPSSQTTFREVPALRYTQITSGSYSAGGASVSLGNTSNRYSSPDTGNAVAEDSTAAAILFTTNTLPTTAKAGDAGPIWTARYYTPGKVTDPGIGRSSATYVVEKDAATSVLFSIVEELFGDSCGYPISRISTSGQPCVVLTRTDPAFVHSVLVARTKYTYRVTTTGTITPHSGTSERYADTGSVYQRLVLTF